MRHPRSSTSARLSPGGSESMSAIIEDCVALWTAIQPMKVARSTSTSLHCADRLEGRGGFYLRWAVHGARLHSYSRECLGRSGETGERGAGQ